MNDTTLPAIPTREEMLDRMATTLANGVQEGAVDLGDERTIICRLVDAGFSKVDFQHLGEAAINRARAVVQGPEAPTELIKREDFTDLPGGIVIEQEFDEDGIPQARSIRDLSKATVAELRFAIDFQTGEVERAAVGLQSLRSLLKRRLSQGAAEADLAYLPTDDLFGLSDALTTGGR